MDRQSSWWRIYVVGSQHHFSIAELTGRRERDPRRAVGEDVPESVALAAARVLEQIENVEGSGVETKAPVFNGLLTEPIPDSVPIDVVCVCGANNRMHERARMN